MPQGAQHQGGWHVDVTLVEEWLTGLDEATYVQAIAAATLLSERGPSLGRPLVDTVTASRHKNMKELRPGSAGRSEIRILFAFDPERRAILLLGGDKQGRWQKWYRVNIPIADNLFDQHLAQLRERGKEKGR
ncbi:hypothetical protein GCM10009809_38150 [Isoptericola hypogeus]|uniref:Diaminopimelate decarboxylase n=1 Tax=Isoptericola hypogeus TaxID=300179 RepID=A0ABN2JU49_9MICO